MTFLVSFFLFLQCLYAEEPQALLETSYQNGQYLGLAVGNHSSVSSLQELYHFLEKSAGRDPNFKFIFFEGPYDLSLIAKRASRNEFPWYELSGRMDYFWAQRIFSQPQLKFIFSEILSLVQEINLERRENPILLIPIDSYEKKRQQRDEYIYENNNHFVFGGSISREELTAKNFRKETAEFPNAKGVIFYHQAHILKRLFALGQRVDSLWNLSSSQISPLAWVDFMNDSDPSFYGSLQVIFLDEKDTQYNPSGVFKINGLARPKSWGIHVTHSDFDSSMLILSEDSFLLRYRGSSIQFSNDLQKHFDGIIWL